MQLQLSRCGKDGAGQSVSGGALCPRHVMIVHARWPLSRTVRARVQCRTTGNTHPRVSPD